MERWVLGWGEWLQDCEVACTAQSLAWPTAGRPWLLWQASKARLGWHPDVFVAQTGPAAHRHARFMQTEQLLISTILAVTVGMFLWARWRHDMVTAGALLACVLVGLVGLVGGLVAPVAPVASALAFVGFGHPAVITVACMLVLSRGLQSSGAVNVLTRTLLPATAGPTISIATPKANGYREFRDWRLPDQSARMARQQVHRQDLA